MRFPEKNNIIDFFDVSIIMPFYKRLKQFKKTLPKNAAYFQKKGLEVLIVLDDYEEEDELLSFIENYHLINFKIIINRKKHGWRNPCKVLNVGIRKASFNYILVLDPEVELITDVVYQLRYAITYYPNSYTTGVVAFVDDNDKMHQLKNAKWVSYGSIMISKSDLINIRGYSENFTKWGGEDDQIRTKLNLIGLKKIELPSARVLHREKNSDRHLERSSRIRKMPIKHLKHIFYPKKPIMNDKNWGEDFNECIWDWRTDNV